MMNKCDLNVCLPVFPPRRKTRLTFAIKMPFKELSEKQFPSIQVLTPVLGHPGLAGMLPPHSTEMTSSSRTERGKAHPKQQQGKLSPKSALHSAYPHACPQTDTGGLQEQLSRERTQSFHLSSDCRINASQREEPHLRGFLLSFIFPSVTRRCRAASCSAGKVPPASHPSKTDFHGTAQFSGCTNVRTWCQPVLML